MLGVLRKNAIKLIVLIRGEAFWHTPLIFIRSNRMKQYILLFIILLCLYSCQQAERGLMQINAAEDYENIAEVNLSEVVESLEYIQLETDTTCIIGRNPEFYVTKDYVVSIDGNRCLQFSRKDGKFVCEVLHRGQDDTGYKSSLRGGNVALIEETGELMLKGWKTNEVVIHSLSTGEKRTLKLHGESPSVAPLDAETFVSASLNVLGNEPYTMFLYNKGEAIDSIANTQLFDNPENVVLIITNDDFFYRHAGKTYYKNMTNDTLYHVDLQGKHPYAVFMLGNKAVTMEMRYKPDLFRNLQPLQINRITDGNDAIFYLIRQGKETFQMIYNKANGRGGRIEDKGLKNDIDGKVDLWPYRITKDNEYIFVVDPTTLNDNELTNLGIDAEDNPVIVIGKK